MGLVRPHVCHVAIWARAGCHIGDTHSLRGRGPFTGTSAQWTARPFRMNDTRETDTLTIARHNLVLETGWEFHLPQGGSPGSVQGGQEARGN